MASGRQGRLPQFEMDVQGSWGKDADAEHSCSSTSVSKKESSLRPCACSIKQQSLAVSTQNALEGRNYEEQALQGREEPMPHVCALQRSPIALGFGRHEARHRPSSGDHLRCTCLMRVAQVLPHSLRAWLPENVPSLFPGQSCCRRAWNGIVQEQCCKWNNGTTTAGLFVK